MKMEFNLHIHLISSDYNSETGKQGFSIIEEPNPDALKAVVLLLVVCVPCCLYNPMLSICT